MASRSHTPSHEAYGSVPAPNPAHLSRGYGPSANDPSHLSAGDTGIQDFAQGNPTDPSPLSQSLPHTRPGDDDDYEGNQYGSAAGAPEGAGVDRSASTATTLQHGATPSRSGTLKKKGSVSRKSSLKRSGSVKSSRPGSAKGVTIQDDPMRLDNFNSVFHTPIPTTGTPTDILANRFQAWRKFLKDLIGYFHEIQSSYETRAKAIMKVSNVINNTSAPSIFLTEGGINDANRILRDYHKQSLVEANKARDIEIDVVTQLSGLRSDLGQKVKEIKSLAGDFKNSVDKEKEATKRAVTAYEDALIAVDTNPHSVVGKDDPYIIRLAVERQVERQIDEENYLHKAYLNLEGSGRELESIVVGEIQKAYNALAGILKRDADEAYNAVDELKSGPIAMPKDLEWNQFVEHDPHFVNPNLPLRRLEDIEYPGKHHPAAAEVRAGMLERKSKYLKSYTPGWYVLSPTHLHEFKSADSIYTQSPVMSLFLPDQKLGSHSQPGSSSHKFMLKGKQAGSMHRGHSWVFRAESYDTMMAWYEDIKNLTEKTGEERITYVRKHARSISGHSAKAESISGESGLDEDEADEVPYSAGASMKQQTLEPPPKRPQPGGRFPSDIQVNRHLQAPLSPSSGSSDIEHDLTTASGGPRHQQPQHQQGGGVPFPSGPVHEDREKVQQDESRYAQAQQPALAQQSRHHTDAREEPSVEQEYGQLDRAYAAPIPTSNHPPASQILDRGPSEYASGQPHEGYGADTGPPTASAASYPPQSASATNNQPVPAQNYPAEQSFLGQRPPDASGHTSTLHQQSAPVQTQPSEQPFLGRDQPDQSRQISAIDQQTAPTQTYPTEESFLGQGQPDLDRPPDNRGDWIPPVAGGAVVGAGAVGAGEYWRNKRQQAEERTGPSTEVQETPAPQPEREQKLEQEQGPKQEMVQTTERTREQNRESTPEQKLGQKQEREQEPQSQPQPEPEPALNFEPIGPVPAILPVDVLALPEYEDAAKEPEQKPVQGSKQELKQESEEESDRTLEQKLEQEPQRQPAEDFEPTDPVPATQPIGVIARPAYEDIAISTDSTPATEHEDVLAKPQYEDAATFTDDLTPTASQDTAPTTYSADMLGETPIQTTTNTLPKAAFEPATMAFLGSLGSGASSSDYTSSSRRGAAQTGHTAYDTNPDGSTNARMTGKIFPAILRHNTDVSISQLHIPGEFPKTPEV